MHWEFEERYKVVEYDEFGDVKRSQVVTGTHYDDAPEYDETSEHAADCLADDWAAESGYMAKIEIVQLD